MIWLSEELSEPSQLEVGCFLVAGVIEGGGGFSCASTSTPLFSSEILVSLVGIGFWDSSGISDFFGLLPSSVLLPFLFPFFFSWLSGLDPLVRLPDLKFLSPFPWCCLCSRWWRPVQVFLITTEFHYGGKLRLFILIIHRDIFNCLILHQ